MEQLLTPRDINFNWETAHTKAFWGEEEKCKQYACFNGIRHDVKKCANSSNQLHLVVPDYVTHTLENDRSKLSPDQTFGHWFLNELKGMGFKFEFEYRDDKMYRKAASTFSWPDTHLWRVTLDLGKYSAVELFTLYCLVRLMWEHTPNAASYYYLRHAHPDIAPFTLLMLAHTNNVFSARAAYGHSIYDRQDCLSSLTLDEFFKIERANKPMAAWPNFDYVESGERRSVSGLFWISVNTTKIIEAKVSGGRYCKERLIAQLNINNFQEEFKRNPDMFVNKQLETTYAQYYR